MRVLSFQDKIGSLLETSVPIPDALRGTPFLATS
jgi:hypothetical protein